MRGMKRCLAAMMCAALCLVAFPMPRAMAATPPTGGESEIMPMMEYIYDADYDFVISDGKAVMHALVRGHSATATRCEITVELQEKGLLFWGTAGTWTVAEDGRRAEIDVSHDVTAGEKYRMVTTVTVWSGTDSESETMTSGVLVA